MSAEPKLTVVTPGTLRGWPLPHSEGAKDSRGRALVVGGAVANPGGALLAAEAALRVGAGKVQIVCAEPISTALAVRFPEAMVKGAPSDPDGNLDARAAAVARGLADDAAAVLIGPGLLEPDSAEALGAALLPGLADATVIIDGIGLAWLTPDPARMQQFRGRSVLSPNLNELAITLSADPADVERDIPAAVRELATRTDAVVMSGSADTYVASPDGSLWRIDVGAPGLAVSGSGDVKAGVIVGLCARGVEPAQAAVWAAWLHGSAGQRLAGTVGTTGFLAHELTPEIPAVLHGLQG